MPRGGAQTARCGAQRHHNPSLACPPPTHTQDGKPDLSAAPPFTLGDLRAAIPAHLWKKNVWRSLAYTALDVAVVAALAVGAYKMNIWCVVLADFVCMKGEASQHAALRLLARHFGHQRHMPWL